MRVTANINFTPSSEIKTCQETVLHSHQTSAGAAGRDPALAADVDKSLGGMQGGTTPKHLCQTIQRMQRGVCPPSPRHGGAPGSPRSAARVRSSCLHPQPDVAKSRAQEEQLVATAAYLGAGSGVSVSPRMCCAAQAGAARSQWACWCGSSP